MSIAWRDAMCVGEPMVDEDHKHLIDLINAFELAISGGGKIDHKKIARVLLGLVEYTGEHFAREEELQRAIRYPYHESHCRSHRDVLKKLSDIVTEYSLTPAGPKRERMVRDLAGFLKEWLVDHIIQSDLRMKPYVLQMRAQKAEAVRRKRDAMLASRKMAGIEPELEPLGKVTP